MKKRICKNCKYYEFMGKTEYKLCYQKKIVKMYAGAMCYPSNFGCIYFKERGVK